MSNVVIVLCTCASREEALRIAAALIEARLAACVQILPEIQSVYRWQGAVEISTEVLILIKSTLDRFASVEKRIVEMHSYETPEIIAVPVTAGTEKYLTWLRDSVQPLN